MIDALEWRGRFNPDSVVLKVPREQWRNYVAGITAIFQLVFEQENPEVLITPLRGAEPLRWALEMMAERTGKVMPIVFSLPLGSAVDPDDISSQRGLKGREKVGVIDRYMEANFDWLKAVGWGDRVRTIMVLDEAQSGKTFTQAFRGLRGYLSKSGLDYIRLVGVVAKDDRPETRPVSRSLSALLREGRRDIHLISLAMPYIDRPHLLPMILRQGEREGAPLLDVVANERGEMAVKQIVSEVLEGMNWPYDRV